MIKPNSIYITRIWNLINNYTKLQCGIYNAEKNLNYDFESKNVDLR